MGKLTPQQLSLLGWIERRDENGRGVRYLPRGAWTARVANNLAAKGMIEVGKNVDTGKSMAWRASAKGRAALKETVG